ncbi:MAG: PIN domain-containing protein [Hyphomonadaceae bacterium]|nr:PIN domain-containing protein [Hyphomonadaceae bacterium]
MIVLDTDVVSAIMRPALEPKIARWLAGLGDEPIAVATVTIVEITRGLERLASGRRRDDLTERFEKFVAPANRLTVLSLDEAAARRAGVFLSIRETLGRPVGIADMMIAGVAATNSSELATRNVRDFEGIGLKLVDLR